MGSAVVRAPRLQLAGDELAQARKVIDHAKKRWIPEYQILPQKARPHRKRPVAA